MNELSAFIEKHPLVTFGVFLVAMSLANSVGKLVRIRIGGGKEAK